MLPQGADTIAVPLGTLLVFHRLNVRGYGLTASIRLNPLAPRCMAPARQGLPVMRGHCQTGGNLQRRTAPLVSFPRRRESRFRNVGRVERSETRRQRIEQTIDPWRSTLRSGRASVRGHDGACPSMRWLRFESGQNAFRWQRVQEMPCLGPTPPRDPHAETHQRQVLRGMSICAER